MYMVMRSSRFSDYMSAQKCPNDCAPCISRPVEKSGTCIALLQV
uniref:Uncharacterized protein n=1 Tax=Anguilla anguilla TaxID=7936 RepID=A0A0E9TB64_ANGAN